MAKNTRELIDKIKLALEQKTLSNSQIAYKYFVSGHFVHSVMRGWVK